jgi:hypothetical protein
MLPTSDGITNPGHQLPAITFFNYAAATESRIHSPLQRYFSSPLYAKIFAVWCNNLLVIAIKVIFEYRFHNIFWAEVVS